jgi:hypothetical protein
MNDLIYALGAEVQALLQMGRHADVLAIAEEMSRVEWTAHMAEGLRRAGDCMARAIPVAAADATLDAAERERRVDEYGRRAVEYWTRAAAATGFGGKAQLEKMKSAKILAEREDYKALMARL